MNVYTDFNQKTPANIAFKEIMLECIHHIEKNAKHISDGQDPEFLHQMRVGLRKLYVSMQLLAKLFPDILNDNKFVHFKQEIWHYESTLGKARDWDVFTNSTLPQTILHLGTNKHYKNIQKQATTLGLSIHEHITKFITAKHHLWSGLKTWLSNDFISDITLAKKPIIKFSNTLLQHKQKMMLKHAKLPLQQMSLEEQHKLRIFIKKCHYTFSFFAHLYNEKNVKIYLKTLKKLQDILGDMHDYTVMRELCNKILKQNITTDIGYAEAIGEIIGYKGCKTRQMQDKFDKNLHKLCKLKDIVNS